MAWWDKLLSDQDVAINELQQAVSENRAVAQEAVKIQELEHKRVKSLSNLSSEALRILDRSYDRVKK
jgi:hypothetical protein